MIIKKHKNKIIAAAAIIAVLIIAWITASDYPASYPNGSDTVLVAPQITAEADTSVDTPDIEMLQEAAEITNEPAITKEVVSTTDLPEATETITEPVTPIQTEAPAIVATNAPAESSTQPPAVVSTTEKSTNPPPTIESATQPPATQEISRTEPAAEYRPEPVEPENIIIGDGAFIVTLTVRVDTLLNNMHLLNREKHELVPADGVIFPVTEVTVNEGESVFNVLQREMRRARIHMVSRFTPIYNSAYIEAINNIYEFDAGNLSGWSYSVNGWFPNYGSSRYVLQPGDVLEWHYTVDLGRDLGQEFSEGGQNDE